MESILTSIKKLLGIAEEYTHFDTDIVIHINSTFSVLNQLGVGPSAGFSIQDSLASWQDYMDEGPVLEMVKTLVFLKVRLVFDPPTSSALLEAMKQQISELEWRAMVAAEQEHKKDEEADDSKRNIVLKDQFTGTNYKIFVSDSKLTMEQE